MSQIGLHTDFFIHVMPSEIVMSMGMGFAFVSLSSTALVGVSHHDAGVASATLNTSQQIGGTLGTALLNTIAANATRNYIGKNFANQTVVLNGTIHGFSVGFLVGAFCLLVASIISVVMISDPHKDKSLRVSSSEVMLAST